MMMLLLALIFPPHHLRDTNIIFFLSKKTHTLFTLKLSYFCVFGGGGRPELRTAPKEKKSVCPKEGREGLKK